MALNSEIFAARAELCVREAEKCTLPRARAQLVIAAEVWREKSRYAVQFEPGDSRPTAAGNPPVTELGTVHAVIRSSRRSRPELAAGCIDVTRLMRRS
jgi:hypothetical protein